MSTKGGFDYTTFKGVNLRTTAGIRFEMDGGFAGTLAVKGSPDANKQWYLPDKSGSIGITGTVQVYLPAIDAGDWYGTNIVVSGVRAEDAMLCTIQKTLQTVTTERSLPLLAGVHCGNGGVCLTFVNPSTTATLYGEPIIAYTIVR